MSKQVLEHQQIMSTHVFEYLT